MAKGKTLFRWFEERRVIYAILVLLIAFIPYSIIYKKKIPIKDPIIVKVQCPSKEMAREMKNYLVRQALIRNKFCIEVAGPLVPRKRGVDSFIEVLGEGILIEEAHLPNGKVVFFYLELFPRSFMIPPAAP